MRTWIHFAFNITYHPPRVSPWARRCRGLGDQSSSSSVGLHKETLKVELWFPLHLFLVQLMNFYLLIMTPPDVANLLVGHQCFPCSLYSSWCLTIIDSLSSIFQFKQASLRKTLVKYFYLGKDVIWFEVLLSFIDGRRGFYYFFQAIMAFDTSWSKSWRWSNQASRLLDADNAIWTSCSGVVYHICTSYYQSKY